MPVLDIVGAGTPLAGLEDIQFRGQTVDLEVREIIVNGDRVFLSGDIRDHSNEIFNEFFVELTPDEIEKISGMEKMSTTRARVDIVTPHMADILNGVLDDNRSANVVLSEGETFTDTRNAITSHIELEAVVPEIERAPEPEGLKPANLEAGDVIRVQDFQSDGPVLIENFDVNGQAGDLVIHDIEFSDGKPFLTGTFSVETPTGSQSKEFAVAIDHTRFPDVSDLSVDDVTKLTSSDILQEMLETKQHSLVLSTGEGFTDRARLLEDINGIRAINQGAYNEDIPHLARLGQEYPELIETLNIYKTSWSPFGRDEALIKLTVLDHLGIEDPGLRSMLVDDTDGLKNFADRLGQRADLVNAGPETRAAVSHMAAHAGELASAGRPAASLSKVGATARLFGGVTAIGTGLSAVSASASTYEGYTKTELTNQQFEDGLITEIQRDALLEFHADTTEAQLGDAAFGMADQFILPSLFVTYNVEREAKEALTKISNETGLSESIYQSHARSLFGGHTASYDAMSSAIDELPRSVEGQPEILHAAIELRENLRYAQNELMTYAAPYASIVVRPDDVQENINARGELIDGMKSQLEHEMELLLGNPESIEVLLGIIPIDDRIDFVKALASGDPDLAANNPIVAEATRDFSGRGGTALHAENVREAKAVLSEDNGAGLNAYIISRVLPDAEESLPAAEHNVDSCWDEGVVAQYYNSQALAELEGIAVVEFDAARSPAPVVDPGLKVAMEQHHDAAPSVG